MKKLLITGGTGYLGQHLLQAATTWELHATIFRTPSPPSSRAQLHPCDLRDPTQVQKLITSVRPDVIIHNACSNRTTEGLDSIIPAATNFADLLHGTDIRFLHLSTDLIFNGDHAPYREEDVPSPLTPYGHAKVKAEDIISANVPNALNVRPSLIYGINPIDHQTGWLLEGMEKKETVRLFTDEIRCPIWVDTLAQALLELAQATCTGILHVASPTPMNRWEFGMAMLAMLGKSPSPHLVPSTVAASGLTRPRNLTLSVEKAQRMLTTPLLSVSEVRAKLSR